MHQERLAHQIARQAADNLNGVVVGADFDVPRVRTAGPGQLRHGATETKHEDLCLDRSAGVERRQILGWVQTGCAMASTCSGVTCMLCASRPCFYTAGISLFSDPRAT